MLALRLKAASRTEHCDAGLAIYDIMQYIRSPISTVGLGQPASMDSLLLAAGAKGQRRPLPNAAVMISSAFRRVQWTG